MVNLQNENVRDARLVAMVERLEAIDSFYGITPEERDVLDVIHGVADIAEENEE